MTERGISFSAPMVRALLAGTKTQTRRIVKEKNVPAALRDGPGSACCPFTVGDRLWVREAYRLPESVDAFSPTEAGTRLLAAGADPSTVPICYDADGATRHWPVDGAPCLPGKRRMGMFMPRWGSRIVLDVVDVRMERLDECSAADAVAEGIERLEDVDGAARWRVYGPSPASTSDARLSYRSLWEQINGAGSWEANPLIWVVVFHVGAIGGPVP